MRASNSKKYLPKGFQEKATDNKNGSVNEETNVVMFKWKGMTSRVTLSFNTIVRTQLLRVQASSSSKFFERVLRDRGYPLLLATHRSSAAKVGNFQLSNVTKYLTSNKQPIKKNVFYLSTFTRQEVLLYRERMKFFDMNKHSFKKGC